MKIILLIILTISISDLIGQHSNKERSDYFYGEQIEYKEQSSTSKKLNLIVNTEEVHEIENFENEKERVFKGKLINHTNKTKRIITQDGELMMILEARKASEWYPIEYYLLSDCGMSYHASLSLGPNRMIEFNVPKYGGAFATKMRLKLFTGKVFLYSNEFEGQIEAKKLEPLSDNAPFYMLDGLTKDDLKHVSKIYRRNKGWRR